MDNRRKKIKSIKITLKFISDRLNGLQDDVLDKLHNRLLTIITSAEEAAEYERNLDGENR